jgi:hypothetical protein
MSRGLYSVSPPLQWSSQIVTLIIILMSIIHALDRTLKDSGQLHYAPCYRLHPSCHAVSSKYTGIHTAELVERRGDNRAMQGSRDLQGRLRIDTYRLPQTKLVQTINCKTKQRGGDLNEAHVTCTERIQSDL